MGSLSILKILRPWQWIKNTVVFTVFIGAGLTSTHEFINLTYSFLGMCLIASAGYIINDFADKKMDALHPHKKNRPIADGSITTLNAVLLMLTLLTTGLFVLIQINFSVLVLGILYFLISISYTYFLKYKKYVDSLSITILFLLRAYIGSQTINVDISIYLFLFITTSSLMVSISKKISILSNTEVKHVYKNYLMEKYDVKNLVYLFNVLSISSLIIYSSWLFGKLENFYFLNFILLFLSGFSLNQIFKTILKNSLDSKMEDISKDFFQNQVILINILIVACLTFYIIYINN